MCKQVCLCTLTSLKLLHEGMCVCARTWAQESESMFLAARSLQKRSLWKAALTEHPSPSCQTVVACWSNVVSEEGSFISWDKPHTSRACIQPGREQKWDKRTAQVSRRCHCVHSECNDSVPSEAMGWEEQASFLGRTSEIETGQSKHASTWNQTSCMLPVSGML